MAQEERVEERKMMIILNQVLNGLKYFYCIPNLQKIVHQRPLAKVYCYVQNALVECSWSATIAATRTFQYLCLFCIP